MIPPVSPIQPIPSRLPQLHGRFGRKMTCHCCGDPFTTAKPQDPNRKADFGTCEGCRNSVALTMSTDGFAGRVFTVAQSLTHLSRFA